MRNSSTYTGIMARAALCTVVLSVLLMLHPSKAGAGEILVPPESQAVPLGTNATFFCSGRGATTNWIINNTVVGFGNRKSFEDKGFVFKMDRIQSTSSHEDNINNLTMTVLATNRNNNTEIKCISTPQVSGVAYFVVIGNLPPVQLTVSVLNATTLQVSWDPPFIFTGHEILHYDITVENKTTGETIIDSRRVLGAEERVVYVNGEIAQKCNEITFTVTATNDLGEGDPTTVSGWLPIAPGPFSSPPEIEILFESDGTPVAQITFGLPEVCPSQEIEYTIIIEGTKDGEVIDVFIIGPTTVSYGEGTLVVENTTDVGKLMTDAYYGATIDVETIAGSRTSPANSESTVEVGGQEQSDGANDDSVVVATIVAGCGGVLLLAAGITVAVVVIICVHRKNVQANTECEKHPAPPMVSNPLYEAEDPVYETIDEVVASFRPSLPSSPPLQESSITSEPFYENNRLPQPNGSLPTDAVIPSNGSLPTEAVIPSNGSLPTEVVIPSNPISEDSYNYMSSAGTGVANTRPKVLIEEEPPRSEIVRYVRS